ncbi:uncharacterized protein BCR38DRAFT_304213, partial [Pseudomassariella vexata]
MYFLRIATVAVAAMLSTTGLACKCFTNGNPNDGQTRTCCSQYHGVFHGNDCAASSISEHLRGFRSCCGGQSDCDF